jgi:hypothetical protein
LDTADLEVVGDAEKDWAHGVLSSGRWLSVKKSIFDVTSWRVTRVG